jgi:hypothetical protein
VTATEPDAAAGDVIVPLHSRRRQRLGLGQKLQHVIPAAGLLFGGIQSLTSGVEGFERILAIVGIATSALLMTVFARHVRGLGRPRERHAHGVDWMDIWAAGVLFAEAAEKWRVRGHIWRPETLTALATLGIGLMHGRLAASHERRRSLRITGDGLWIGGRLRFSRPFVSRWNDITEIALSEREAIIRTQSGRTRRLNLADLENAGQVRDALRLGQQRLAEHSA